jgi:hypothetical protein
MCHTLLQCSFTSIHVPYNTYSAVLPVFMRHTHVQCSIASIHVSYTRTVQCCQYACVIHTYSAALLVSMCHTHSCVNQISVFWLYEATASRSDGTGLLKHAALYITYSTIGCTACLYETFPFSNNYSYRNGSQDVALFFMWQRILNWIYFIYLILL